MVEIKVPDPVPDEFSLIALVVIATYFVHLFLSSRVIAARKKYKVSYPTMYVQESDDNKGSKVFNCTQRGHQNFIENVPFFLAMLIFAGLQHPRIASVIGLVYLGARVLYMIDYSSGDPQRRARGALTGYACMFGLTGCMISFCVQKLM